VENKITYLISRINHARKAHPSLQQTNNVRFCYIDNDQVIAFYKWNADKSDEMLVVISLDSNATQQGFVQLPLEAMKLTEGFRLGLKDLMTDNSYFWSSEWNFVALNPNLPFHLFQISR
jgi:starch synthase (maltosyl-transferring)